MRLISNKDNRVKVGSMNVYEIGDIIKLTESNRVFRFTGTTRGHELIPDGFLVTDEGHYLNPAFCKKYNGATSVLPESIRSIGVKL